MIKNFEPLIVIQGRVDTVRRATVHVQNEGSEGDSVYECSKQHFVFKKLCPL